ncbi:hypothetical protein Tco_0493676 [Tanacetum coccineum]
MAIMNSCNKHNMIACVETTERNANFHEVIDFLTAVSDETMLYMMSLDVIQQSDSTILDVLRERFVCLMKSAHIEALSTGTKILGQKLQFRTDLIPQWKYLVHTLLHCLSSKSSSWDQFGTNIASALVSRFMSKCSPKFSGKLTPLTPHMLKVATAVRDEHSLPTEELDIYTSSQHSDDPSAGEKAKSPSPVASERTDSPNDYTPTDEVQTSGGDEGNLDLYGLTREVLRLKKLTTKQAAQILRLKTKLKILWKKVKPVISEYKSFVKLNANLSKKKKLKKTHQKKSSSFKQGRKKVSDKSIGLNEVDVDSGDAQVFEGTFEDFEGTAKVHESTAEVHESTAEVHEGTSKVNEGTAEKCKEQKRELSERTKGKVFGKTIAAQRRFRAEQQAALRRSKPPTIPQAKKIRMIKYIRMLWKAYRESQKQELFKNLSGSSMRKGEESMTNLSCYWSTEERTIYYKEKRFSIIQSPEGEYIAVQRANGQIRAFNTLNEVFA